VVPGAPNQVISAPSYSEGRQEYPSTVCYSLDIHASRFSLVIFSATPGRFTLNAKQFGDVLFGSVWSAVMLPQLRSDLPNSRRTQYDHLCIWGSSPACGHSVIPALLYTALHCICGRLYSDLLRSSYSWACCNTTFLCVPIRSRAHSCGPGSNSKTP
jgi:hypothetical protein